MKPPLSAMKLSDLKWHLNNAAISLPGYQISLYRGGDDATPLFDVYLDKLGSPTGLGYEEWLGVDILTAQCILYDLLARYPGGNDAPQ